MSGFKLTDKQKFVLKRFYQLGLPAKAVHGLMPFKVSYGVINQLWFVFRRDQVERLDFIDILTMLLWKGDCNVSTNRVEAEETMDQLPLEDGQEADTLQL